jgi:ribosomal protein S18 acetylase RimI-like enzyme
MNEIVIRNAKPEDAQYINTILYLNWTWSKYYKEIFWDNTKQCKDRIQEDAINNKKEQIKNIDNEKIIIVAEDKESENIIGFCSWLLHSKSNEMENTIKDLYQYSEIKWLYIHPHYHKKGIWWILIKEFEKRISHIWWKKIIIKTLSNSIQSNWFYQKQWYILTPYTCTFTRRDITTTCNIYIKQLNA